jgi:hypothetical protein
MKRPLDKKMSGMGSNSTKNLHQTVNTMKLQKCDDFLSSHHHLSSVQIPSSKYRSQIPGISNFASQNRVDPNPIGPQKLKS